MYVSVTFILYLTMIAAVSYVLGFILCIGIHKSLEDDLEQSASHGIDETRSIVDDAILCPSPTAPITITITLVIVIDSCRRKIR